MSFLGPDVKLDQPKWRQRWWWREHLPGAIGLLVVVALAVGTVVVVFALDDDDAGEAGSPPADTASRSSEASPSNRRPHEKPPTLPDKAREPTREGIEATIRFEIDALNYAQRTADFDPLKSVYNMSSCKSCQLIVEKISNSLSNGATYVDFEYVITSIEVTPVIGDRGEAAGHADVYSKQPRDARLIDRSGKEIERIPAIPEVKAVYDLEYSADGWVIQEIRPGNKP